MRKSLEIIAADGGAAALYDADPPSGPVALAWLGQAGFLLRAGGLRLLIDPYLSDHLAAKYAGQEFPHLRMMPSPLRADRLRGLDVVLCTHRHSDHMDYGCLSTLAANNLRCRFVVPRAEIDSAARAGLAIDRLIAVIEGEAVHLAAGVEVVPLPAAHETLQTNPRGEHLCLGYVLRLGGLTLFHGGDGVVYPGLAQRLRGLGVDLALLPCNGRSEHLTARGIAGNMTFAEACDLCRQAGIATLIPHHFGMFAFNTVDRADLERQAAALDASDLRCVIPRADQHYLLSPAGAAPDPVPASQAPEVTPMHPHDEPLISANERFFLDTVSPVPLYHQIEQILLDRITGQNAMGRLLPSEKDLMVIFSVSRATARKVYENLASKGLVERRRALGTRVIAREITEDLGRLKSYTEEMRLKGLQVTTRLLSAGLHVPDERVRSRLKLAAGEQTLQLRRLRGTSEVFPIVLLTSDLPAGLGIEVAQDFSGSLYQLIEEKYHIPIEYGDEEIRVAQATPEEAQLLGVEVGSGLLCIERVTCTRGDRPVEFVRGVYRPEHYTFSIRIPR